MLFNIQVKHVSKYGGLITLFILTRVFLGPCCFKACICSFISGCAGSLAAQAFLQLWQAGSGFCSWQWPLVAEHSLWARGPQCFRHVGSVVAAPGPQRTGSAVVARGLAALRHVASSRVRGQTHGSCTGRSILCH